MTPGAGYVRPGDFPISHPQFGALIPCPACSSGRLPAYLRQCSRLAGELARASFAGYIQADDRTGQLAAAGAVVKAGRGWLTLWGQNGRGKSYTLACIVNAALDAGRPAVYTTAADLLDHLRSAYNPHGPGFSDAFEYWRAAAVLAVDEVSEYYATSWADEKLRQLLGYRYDRRDTLITVFACEMQPGGDDWPANLGWLYSRMSQGEVVHCGGGDVRPLLRGR